MIKWTSFLNCLQLNLAAASQNQAVSEAGYGSSLKKRGFCKMVGYDLVRNSGMRPNPETDKMERYSHKDKNERFRDLLHQAHFMHHIPFEWIMADCWFVNVKNLRYIVQKLKKDFLFGLKVNRNVALSKSQARQKDFVKFADLSLQPGEVQQIWLDRLPFPLYLSKELYVNKDQSKGSFS